ncbi:VirD4-like conjugal transfer protein, CD1115 family [Paenibacillus shenyangensis]|uniref:VirD4-like conjugal transfer protein, CD1115 family n=1 Tax=Paenibacillus sp. A9 TaxID=1284352 RepID=UPI000363AEF5|nr:type IV secretory system conjugative DNA transfer family protein [Paenibacillus sp. A9]
MTEQEKRKKQNRNFLITCAVVYVCVAFITIHAYAAFEKTGEPFEIENIHFDELTTATQHSIIENIIVFPSPETRQFLFVELVAIFIYALYKITSQKNLMPGKEHGTAKFGGSSERNKLRNKDPQNNMILTQTERLSLDGKQSKRNLNLLVMGGSGTGKSRFLVKPNILQANTSFVITDPKGELLQETGYALKNQGYKIKVFNLINMAISSGYNPFAYIRQEKDVLKVINALMKNTSGNKSGGDPFWESAEKALLLSIFFYIFYELPTHEHNIPTVFTMLRLIEIREDQEDFKSEFDFLFELLRQEKPNHIALKQYDVFKMASGKTAKSILISAGVRLAPFGIEEVEKLLSQDELELATLGDEKTALFVIIPDGDTTFNFIAAMMYTQLFDTLLYQADFVHGGRLPIHVKCWLDEFANIGQIPDFEKLIATVRSREISVAPIVQAMTQLKSLYKDSWETIMGNCDSVLFLGGQERATLEWVSKGLGKKTIDIKNTSRSRGKSGSSSVSYSTMGRELMTVDELAQMPNSKCILFVRGFSAFYSDKYNLLKHPNYKLLFEANEGNRFDYSMLHDDHVETEDDEIAKAVNMRVPDVLLNERIDEVKIVDIKKLDEIEDQIKSII